jgi:hypothetical protein
LRWFFADVVATALYSLSQKEQHQRQVACPLQYSDTYLDDEDAILGNPGRPDCSFVEKPLQNEAPPPRLNGGQLGNIRRQALDVSVGQCVGLFVEGSSWLE